MDNTDYSYLDSAVTVMYGAQVTIGDSFTTVDGWFKCPEGKSPIIKVVKDPDSNRYRILVKGCPEK